MGASICEHHHSLGRFRSPLKPVNGEMLFERSVSKAIQNILASKILTIKDTRFMNMNINNEKIIIIVSATALGAFFLGNPPAEASGHCTFTDAVTDTDTDTDTGEKLVVQSGVLCPTTSLSNVAWTAER